MKEHCLGAYLLDPDDTVKFVAFDLDLSKSAQYFLVHDIEQINELEEQQYNFDLDLQDPSDLEYALHNEFHPAHRWARIVLLECVRKVSRAVARELDMISLSVITGGGAHVFVPLPESVPAEIARDAAWGVMDGLTVQQINDNFFDYGAHREISIEIFPNRAPSRVPTGSATSSACHSAGITKLAFVLIRSTRKRIESDLDVQQSVQSRCVAGSGSTASLEFRTWTTGKGS